MLRPEEARGEARRILADVARGIDPKPALPPRERWRPSSRSGCVGTRLATGAEEVRRIMAREVLPHLGALSLEEVRKRDIIAVIDSVADHGPRCWPTACSRISSGYFDGLPVAT